MGRSLGKVTEALRAVALLKQAQSVASCGFQQLQNPSVRSALSGFRKWIWIGVGYNFAVALVLTYLVGIALTYMNPPKARPTTPADEVAMRNKIHQEAVKRSRTQRRLKVPGQAPTCRHYLLHLSACSLRLRQAAVQQLPRQALLR